MGRDFDVILLGAGHNSLVLQGYLGRAGLRTVCLESRDVAGGGLTTIEYPAGTGFLHNTHSFYHRGLDQMPWYQDLELARFGARYLQPELNVAMPVRPGQALCWWSDFERTAESFAKFDLQDSERLRFWRRRFEPILQEILIPESRSPPLPSQERTALLSSFRLGRQLLEVSRLSPLEFVRREFRHPAIQAGLLFFNGLREVDLRCPGFGHHIPALLASSSLAQICVGGSHRLAAALLAVVEATGGEVWTGTTPRRLLLDGERVRGLELQDGRTLFAQAIVSGLNPLQTFVELVEDTSQLPAGMAGTIGELRGRALSFRYNLLAPLFGCYVNLRSPPDYEAACEVEGLNAALMVILGLQHVDQFGEIVRHHEAGTIPPTVSWGSCPTRFDPSQAPPGQHTAFQWEKLPYRLHGDPLQWQAWRDRHAEQLLAHWSSFAPNLFTDRLDHFALSPLDTRRELWNMAEGDLLVGAFTNGQVGADRPFPGAGQYRTPLQGLYLCGSCCHPGGNITGLPGYNCAQVLLRDLQLPAPMAGPSLRERFQQLALRDSSSA